MTEHLLQRRLHTRDRGGPHEQIKSRPARLRGTRSCEIIHSSLIEPLNVYKSLEPLRPQCPTSWRRFHLNDGIRVVDQDTVVISANDTLRKTKRGVSRSSGGTVTYSATHRLKVELDVEVLAQILGDGVPGGGLAWTPRRLEWIFKERTGRPGSWVHYDLGIKGFLMLFPKTFELFGDGKYVQMRRKRGTIVLDDFEAAIVRLARSRDDGFLEQSIGAAGNAKTEKLRTVSLPQFKTHRFKAVYAPHGELTSNLLHNEHSNIQEEHEFEGVIVEKDAPLLREPDSDMAMIAECTGEWLRDSGLLSPTSMGGPNSPHGVNGEEGSEAGTEKLFS